MIAPDSLWVGFELTYQGTTYRWCSDLNEQGTDVVWQGNAFPRWPIDAEGFEISGQGKSARPSLRVSNLGGAMGDILRANDNLRGATVTRHRVFVRYLDAVNFAGGNALADPLAGFEPDIYYVDRKKSENRLAIELELASAMDLQGVKVPARVMGTNACTWTDAADCQYVATCKHTLADCRAKWGAGATLPFGGFPALGLRRIR